MIEKFNVLEKATDILTTMQKGALITAMADNDINSMVISWGMLGVEWNKPIFITYVRESRYTKQLLEKNPEFTVNIPLGHLDDKIIKVCGTQSGEKENKLSKLGLTTNSSLSVSVPGIKEVPMTLECKIIYKREQDRQSIPDEIRAKFYPPDVDSSFHGSNRDYHTAYYGEILQSYIIK